MKPEEIKSNLVQVYDKLADYWGSDFSLHDWGVKELQEFTVRVKESGGTKVLDLGCGSGIQSKLLSEHGLDVVGVDLSPRMVEVARKQVPAGNFVKGDILNLPFDDATFDGVYSRASLLHIPKDLLPQALGEINRVLKGEGFFYLAIKEGEGEGEVEDKRHGVRVMRFFSLFKKEEIKELVTAAGFYVTSISTHKREGGSTVWIQIIANKVLNS